MDQLEAHRRAQAAFGSVLQNVSHDQWRGTTPCPEWDVAALVRHVVGGNQRVQELAGEQPVALPDEPAAAHLVSAAAAQQVFEAPDGLTRPFPLPFATLPGSAFIGIRSSDVFAHAWDLAVAHGAADRARRRARHPTARGRPVVCSSHSCGARAGRSASSSRARPTVARPTSSPPSSVAPSTEPQAEAATRSTELSRRVTSSSSMYRTTPARTTPPESARPSWSTTSTA